MQEKKKSFLFRDLNLAFVYLSIFLIGIAIVMFMTTYLNNKVKEFSTESMTTTVSK